MAIRKQPEVNQNHIAIPITVGVAGLVLTVAAFLYNSGSRSGSSEKDLAYLTSRVDALVLGLKDANERIAKTSDHDAVIRLDQRVASLEAAEAGKEIHISMGDEGKKK